MNKENAPSNKPCLVFYTNMPTPYQLDLFRYLKLHFDLSVVYFTGREKDRQWDLHDAGEGYQVILLKNNLIARLVQRFVTSFHYSSEIRSLSSRLKPEFVIVNGTYWSPNVQIALKKSSEMNTLTAFWGEPVFESKNNISNKIKSFFLHRLFSRVDLIFAIGKRAIQSYKSYGFDKKIYNLPYSIDHLPFEEKQLEEALLNSLKEKYKPRGETIFFSSGALIERKGMDIVIKAFLKSNAVSNARLIIIGDGDGKNDLQQLVGSSDRVSFLGFQQKSLIPYLFAICDVFVFGSRYDGWGLVINEAMTAGKTIICSKNVGAGEDLLTNNENAILCDSGSIDQFTDAINRVNSDHELRNKLAKNAKMNSVEITSEKTAEKLYAIYQVG